MQPKSQERGAGEAPWRQLKGCRALPAGVRGVPEKLPFLLSPQAAAEEKERGGKGQARQYTDALPDPS